MYIIKNSILLVGLLLLATITTTQASQNDETSYTIGSWVSEGTTTFAHDASMFEPAFGNPTSKLDYVNIETITSEFQYKSKNANGNTTKFILGKGVITGGSLFDADYLSALGAEQENTTVSGAHRFSYTKSDIIKDDISNFNDYNMSYFSFTLGKNKHVDANTEFEYFGGFQYWKEKYAAKDIYILEFTLICPPDCPLPGDFIPSPRVITNEVTWKSFFVGFDLNRKLTNKFKLNTMIRISPLVDLKNVDHHLLRADNLTVTSTGGGTGVDFEFAANYALTKNVGIELGYRYWYREINDGNVIFLDTTGISPPLPLVEFFSQRYGVTLALNMKL